jgi:SNF2 family DNA or RNA helicase
MSKYHLTEDFYTFQKVDYQRLMDDPTSYLQLSEMGVGKTPVSIGVALSGKYKKTLVVCPKTLRLEWDRQIREWSDVPPTVCRRGSSRRLEPLFDDFMGKAPPNPWFIVNYETFRTRRHLEVLNDYPFDLIIFDEAHKMRNPRTRLTRGVFEFLEHHQKSRVICMTGSPIVNRPADLHTLLRMVRPETYTRLNRTAFEDHYTLIERKNFRRCSQCKKLVPYQFMGYSPQICPSCGNGLFRHFITKKVKGVKNLSELRKETDPFTIRRTKAEVFPDMPSKYYRKVSLEMDSQQRELYKKMENELFVLLDSGEPLWAPTVLAQLTRLRQLNLDPHILGVSCSSIKTDFLQELLEGMNGSPLVAFSTSDAYCQYLHSLPWLPKHIMITGQTPSDERVQLAQEFQNDDSIKLAIGTMAVMGEGITLTRASDVISLDSWWTPTVHDQAYSRVHRATQTRAVQIIEPSVLNSIDQSMVEIRNRKMAMAGEYLGEDSNAEVIEEVLADMRKRRGQTVPEPEDDDTDIPETETETEEETQDV